MATAALHDDIANEDAEEDFDVGMRHHAMELDAADRDNDGMLDFAEFSRLIREREVGPFDVEVLRKRFDALDASKDGRVQMNEYLRYALRDALARSSERVIDLLTQWDADKSGQIDRIEFRRAVRALGFTANDGEIDLVFDDFDEDGGGTIDYRELNKKMRQSLGIEVEQRHKLRRTSGGRKGAALSTQVKVEVSLDDAEATQAQLRRVLDENAVRIIDLFRDWDEDGDGLIQRGEFVKAMRMLTTPRTREATQTSDYELLFDSFDNDGSGTIEYSELSKLLRRGIDMKNAPKKKKKSSKRKGAADGTLSASQLRLRPSGLPPMHGGGGMPLGGGLPRFGGTYSPSLPSSTVSGFGGQQSISLPALDERFQTVSINAACQCWLMPVKGQNHLRAPTSRILPAKVAHSSVRLPPIR